ncbi:deoxyguanosinetriphosphate triphosphohydrolase [Alteromonas sp. ASW11-130]|uniref:deoxyguanosinetriphosphate triphosphohydrolase n=1 Tax=Alteromonas sp. ASW11-130 TaxID=3015775 RepID=UPI002241B3E8|nr:deoxyguanosinetriphosphate triphosphohydrolase [Alteromonas sp. ASW11-130]MCW8092028.1 deoxyguanosinetriphosphate triphosphohydrolase [Alteromonas sp. ASW11-130]
MTANVFQMPLPIDYQPQPKKVPSSGKPKGWSYLLAKTLAFTKDATHAIRIQQPHSEMVPSWIKKLIVAGQCNTIFVEDLQLPLSEQQQIIELCSLHSVTLVNVKNEKALTAPSLQNVCVGPWIN